jgi:hypothetical protein
MEYYTSCAAPFLVTSKLLLFAPSELYETYVNFKQANGHVCNQDTLETLYHSVAGYFALFPNLTLTAGNKTVNVDELVNVSLACSILYPWLTFALTTFAMLFGIFFLRALFRCIFCCRKSSKNVTPTTPDFFLLQREVSKREMRTKN